MSAEILPWCGSVAIALAAVLILTHPWGPRAHPADDDQHQEADRLVPITSPMQQLLRMRKRSRALYVDRLLDVNTEPWVLTLPEAPDHRYLFQVLSGRADVFDDAAEHVAWTEPQTYVITGPSWRGELPPGVIEHQSLAPIIWLLGRVECTGTSKDDTAVRALLDRISLVPLSSHRQRRGAAHPNFLHTRYDSHRQIPGDF
ncbi:DUF1254 domain-containing protein [Mycobacterium sp. ST-F2]|uniref:DUF1254 domain-containing protein n=1 Tax=Mycobacterium sp. ST-F2 TaxID=1490484 RepID=UPI0009F8258D|nr:DUF1254 domain-containing protein [Mycobacterium sp. ST-F2]